MDASRQLANRGGELGYVLQVETLFEGDLFVSYGQIFLEELAAWDAGPELEMHFAGQTNGLCGVAAPQRICLLTGLHTGWVRLTVELHDVPPAVAEQWEDVVEASFTPTASPLQLIGLMANESYALPLPAGASLRARYCAIGMDAARDGSRSEGDPVLDRYLLQLWPAPPTPDTVLRRHSRTAAYWHDFARNLPNQAEQAARQTEVRLSCQRGLGAPAIES
ncbi:hypothetical protein [Pseudonocardia oroxyli]|uniref:hypothetical protein n=1 Tax=Pseudonocardia oroxyli TaxID=366584 RepID=UPI000B829F8A|nr:hypothetical protein [Pseudonocardia oroxyli]